jgi:hypothetical protein
MQKGKRKACVCTELVVGGTGFLFQRARLSDNWISTNLLSQGNLRIAIQGGLVEELGQETIEGYYIVGLSSHDR